ncbi:Hypothetical predicted protein, partial [Marmota monax]
AEERVPRLRRVVAVRRAGLPRTREEPLLARRIAPAPAGPALRSPALALSGGLGLPEGPEAPRALTAGPPRRGCRRVGWARRLRPARGEDGPCPDAEPRTARCGTGGAWARTGRRRGVPGWGRALSHARSPPPAFLPSPRRSRERWADASRGRRPSFVCARGPRASLGRPNFAAPDRLPSGSCEAWPVEEALGGAWGSPAGGRTERAALDNELGSSKPRPLLAGGVGRPAPPLLGGPTCEERAGCPSQVRRCFKAPRSRTSLHGRSHRL